MKEIRLFIIMLMGAIPLTGQTPDTTFISVSQENGPVEKQQLMEQYDYIFGTMEPTRWLFTLNLTALSGDQNGLIRASAEVKLTPAFSLHGSYGIGYSSSYFSLDPNISNHRFGLESRWYYAMPRRIRQGISRNNMSGNYIGLEAAYTHSNTQHYILKDQKSFALRYGLQRRLFRYGFMDIGFGVGMLQNKYPEIQPTAQKKWDLFANAQIGLGLALARPKTNASAGGYCDVLRCFREERQMWKVDLYNLIRINDLDDVKGRLSIGYERKLGNSPFSLEVQGEWSKEYKQVYYAEINTSEITENSTRYGGSLQPRFYYTQNRRIAKGKSGNNLSGVYLGTQLQWLETRSRQEGFQCGVGGCFPYDYRSTIQRLGTGLVWGIQHRLLNHGFIDLNVGFSADRVRHTLTPANEPSITNTIMEFGPLVNLRAGLAF